MTHFIAMSGAHGCLPDSCQSYDSEAEAESALADMFSLSRGQRETLRQVGIVELDQDDDEQVGADYCEIQSCDCDNPAQHNDL